MELKVEEAYHLLDGLLTNHKLKNSFVRGGIANFPLISPTVKKRKVEEKEKKEEESR
jgi:hypothetical protein